MSPIPPETIGSLFDILTYRRYCSYLLFPAFLAIPRFCLQYRSRLCERDRKHEFIRGSSVSFALSHSRANAPSIYYVHPILSLRHVSSISLYISIFTAALFLIVFYHVYGVFSGNRVLFVRGIEKY